MRAWERETVKQAAAARGVPVPKRPLDACWARKAIADERERRREKHRDEFDEQPWVKELTMKKSGTATQPPAIDARALDGHSFRVRLAGLGISYDAETQLQPPRPKVDAAVQAALDVQHAERQKVSEARAKTFAEDAINGRTAPPRNIEHRLRELGVGDVRGSEFRLPPVPPPPPERMPPDPRANREARARRSLGHKLVTAEMHHRPINARGLNEWEYRELLRRRGLSLAPVIASRPKVEK